MLRCPLILILGFLFLPLITEAQQTALFTEANLHYKKGEDYYHKGLFGLAQQEYEHVLELLRPANEPEYELLGTLAELQYAKTAVRLDQPDGEKLVLDFSKKYAADPLSQQALIEIANYYYNDRKYDEAINMFSRVETYGLGRDQRSEVKFKEGYCHFVKKDFRKAKPLFQQIKDIENEFYYPANYYYGLTEFFDNNYDQAILSFQKAAQSRKYDSHVPYYITQIYFAKGEYDNVIRYARPKTQDNSLRNRAEINMLVGQAYFEKEEYDKSLEFFEYFSSRVNRKRPEDFYQIGYAYYKAGNYSMAIENFEQLSSEESVVGQAGMYHLADSYLKLGEKTDARNAFGFASRMEYDPVLSREALFNYAKLSYELGFDRDALAALQEVPTSSIYYNEAQDLMSDLFLQSGDYAKAIEVIEAMPRQTPKLQETYQKVTYYRGLQLYRDGDLDGAKIHFRKSLEAPLNRRTRALAIYWLADIAHQERQYELSIAEMNKFLSLASNLPGLPPESSLYMAHYIQGYNYIKQKNYNTAFGYFQDAIAGIKQDRSRIENSYIKNEVLADALLRGGDALFKRNRYDEAVRLYDEVIREQFTGFVYALYQKAIIEGLRGNTTEKILALERIANNYPNSQYADDALLQLGISYQNLGKLALASQPLQRLVTQYRNKSNLLTAALLRLGLISYNQGNVQGALGYYKDVFNFNPTPEEAQSAIGAIEEIYVDDLGQPERFFAFLETIPGYNVGDSEKETITFESAEAQYENANYERAIQSFTKYLQLYPNGRYSLQAYYNRGESHAVLKDYTAALADYDLVVSRGLSNFYTKALRKAAIISYLHEKNYEKSYQYYSLLEESALSEGERFEAQLGAMQSAYQIKNFDAAYQLARKVINNPRSNDDQKATANFYTGKIAFDRKNYNEAISSFEIVTDLVNNEQAAEARYHNALAHYLKRDLETAKQMTLNANKQSSAYPYWVAKSVILLADILAEQGDLLNARAVLEGLLENYREDQELVSIAQAKLEKLKQQASSASRIEKAPANGLLEMEEED